MQRAMSSLMICLLVLATTPSFATSGAHFFPDTSASVDSTTGALSVFIDEGGVGQQLVNYSVTWSGTATYECINGGSNHPKAANKATVSSGGTASFSTSPINGRVEATFVVPNTPPGPGTFSCPSGQTLVFANVSYTVTITDTTNTATSGTLKAAGGPF